jgi:hypothetical protein
VIAGSGSLAPSADASRVRTPSPASSALADEIAALDGAREALASGDAPRALRALDAHDRAFPRGALSPEATVLRIEALARRGVVRRSAAQLRALTWPRKAETLTG